MTVSRIKEMISNLKRALLPNQTILVSSIGNAQRIVRRICILMLKCEGLIMILQGGNVLSMFQKFE